MTDRTQPEALRLAALLDADEWPGSMTLVSYARACVAELCRQHARIADLEAQLEAIGAGGVDGPHRAVQLVEVQQTAPSATAAVVVYEQKENEMMQDTPAPPRGAAKVE